MYVPLMGGVHMNYNYKNLIIEMVNRIEDSDERFLIQIYTIIKKHLERIGRH